MKDLLVRIPLPDGMDERLKDIADNHVPPLHIKQLVAKYVVSSVERDERKAAKSD
jgi:hypothetical protein